MAGFSADTFEEAWIDWQKASFQRIYTILEKTGVRMPSCSGFKYRKQIGEYCIGNGGYEHLHFHAFKPTKVEFVPIDSIILERKPDKAAQRRWQNGGSQRSTHVYRYSTGEDRQKVKSSSNMQGIEVTQSVSVGGEGYGVSVESETSIAVKAEFQQGYEQSKSESRSEEDETQITVPSGRIVEIYTKKFVTKTKEIEDKYIHCDLGFTFHCHKSRNPRDGKFSKSEDWKRTGSSARRFCVFNSFNDFKMFLSGKNPRYPKQTKNYLRDSKIVSKNFQWLLDNAKFVVKEENIFNNGSYGDVTITEYAINETPSRAEREHMRRKFNSG